MCLLHYSIIKVRYINCKIRFTSLGLLSLRFVDCRSCFPVLSANYIISCSLDVVNTFLFYFRSLKLRRRRDLNPRAAINDLLPFQGSPFSRLGTSPSALKHFNLENNKTTKLFRQFLTEKVGFEPTVPFGITGFQDQLLKPLGHLSISCLLVFERLIKIPYLAFTVKFFS